MKTMSVEVEFSRAESAILRRMLEDHGGMLRERWGVETVAGLVHLLAMHGADEFDGIKARERDDGDGREERKEMR